MNIQRLEYKDLAFLQDVQPADWGSILPGLEFYIKTPFCFPIKILQQETIAGIGAAILHHEVAWLAHIIVAPAYRGKGIGAFITQYLVDFAKTKQCRTIYLIATDLGAPVYAKLGFVTETEYLFFKDLSPLASGEEASNIIPYEPGFALPLTEMDRRVTGENRQLLFEKHLPETFIYKTDQALEGYYFKGLGEGPIIAANPTAGIALMEKRSLTSSYISFPVDNLHARDFLYQQHYQEFKTAPRMRLGQKRECQLEKIYARTGGNLG